MRQYTLTGWTIATTLSPLFLIATAWVIARLVAAGGTTRYFVQLSGYPDYLSFVILGMAFQSLALTALEAGGQAVYQEEQWGTWELLSLAPFRRFTWLFAKTFAAITASLVDLALVLLVSAAIFGLHVTPEGLGVAALGVVLSVLGLVGVAFLMAALGVLWKQPQALAVILSPFVVLLSGMLFPVQALPAAVQAASEAFPLTHGIAIVRGALLLGQGLPVLWPQLVSLAWTGVAFTIVGYGVFRVTERRARRQGLMGRY